MIRQGHALIAVIAIGFCCLGATALDESLSDEQQSTAETGSRDESPHTVHFVTVDSNINWRCLIGAAPAGRLCYWQASVIRLMCSMILHPSSPEYITCTESLGADLAILVVPEPPLRTTQQIGLV